jgi:hypothetical protein
MTVMQEFYLGVVAEQVGRPMQLALAALSGAGISYRVRVATPNVIEYHVPGYNIKGQLTF